MSIDHPDKHVYEIEVRHGALSSLMMEAAVTVNNLDGALMAAVQKAREVLSNHSDVTEVGIYHTYPSPGPVRRYVGAVKRDGAWALSSETD